MALLITNPVGGRIPWVGRYFNIGPVPMSGASTTVKQTTQRLGPSELRRLRQLEEENTRLKKLVADLSLDKVMLQDVVRRKI